MVFVYRITKFYAFNIPVRVVHFSPFTGKKKISVCKKIKMSVISRKINSCKKLIFNFPHKFAAFFIFIRTKISAVIKNFFYGSI